MLIKNNTEANNQLAIRLLDILVNTPPNHDDELYEAMAQELYKSALHFEGTVLYVGANKEFASRFLETLRNTPSDYDDELYEYIEDESGVSTFCVDGITFYAEGINI